MGLEYLLFLNIINMKTIILSDNEIYKEQQLSNKFQIGFLGILPGTNSLPEGNYAVILTGKLTNGDIFQQTIHTFTLNPNLRLERKWSVKDYPIKWLNIRLPDGEVLETYTFILANPLSYTSRLGSKENSKWKYYVIIKDKYVDGDVKFDPPETTKKYCLENIYTISDKTKNIVKTHGAECPVDSFISENNTMTQCLNWRRKDELGEKCKDLLTEEDIKKSTQTFCDRFQYAQDCRCVNRGLDKTYQARTDKHPDHDYCWFTPCKHKGYLVDYTTNNSCSSGNVTLDLEKNDGTIIVGQIFMYIMVVVVILLCCK